MRVIRVFSMLGVLVFLGCVSSKEYKARLADIALITGEKAAVEAERDALAGEKAELQEKLSRLKAEKAELQEGLSALNTETAGLEAEVMGLSAKYAALTSQKTALAGENSALKRTLELKKDELRKEIMKLNAELSKKEQTIKDLSSELGAMNAEIAALQAGAETLRVEKAMALQEREKAVAELKVTYEDLMAQMQEEVEKGEIAVSQLKDRLTLTMVERILFDSGSAELKAGGTDVLLRVGEILKKAKNKRIIIEGHTDNVPISPRLAPKFPTNWELSTARAANVVRHLQEKAGIDPAVLSAAGRGEFMPVAPNETEEGRAKNRRIEILLVPLQ